MRTYFLVGAKEKCPTLTLGSFFSVHSEWSTFLFIRSNVFKNKTPAMHRDIFGLQLTNNRRLIENLPPWQIAIYFGYNVKIRI